MRLGKSSGTVERSPSPGRVRHLAPHRPRAPPPAGHGWAEGPGRSRLSRPSVRPGQGSRRRHVTPRAGRWATPPRPLPSPPPQQYRAGLCPWLRSARPAFTPGRSPAQGGRAARSGPVRAPLAAEGEGRRPRRGRCRSGLRWPRPSPPHPDRSSWARPQRRGDSPAGPARPAPLGSVQLRSAPLGWAPLRPPHLSLPPGPPPAPRDAPTSGAGRGGRTRRCDAAAPGAGPGAGGGATRVMPRGDPAPPALLSWRCHGGVTAAARGWGGSRAEGKGKRPAGKSAPSQLRVPFQEPLPRPCRLVAG